MSVVKGFKKSKKKTHGRKNLFLRKKSALVRVKGFNAVAVLQE